MIMLTPKINLSDYIYLIEIVAHKFRSKVEHIQDSDPYSIASIELVKAIETYDPNLNEDFSRYAYKIMCNGVNDSLRYNKRQKRSALFEDLSHEEWMGIPDKEHPISLPEDLLAKLTDGLNKEDKTILLDVVLHNKKITDLAKEQNVSRVAIYNRIHKIVSNIRESHADLIENLNLN